MNFDSENKVHLERVDETYKHMDMLDAISKEAFPPAERPNIPYYAAHMDKQLLYIMAIVDGEVPVGFLIWLDLGGGFVYLAYFAIDAKYRSHNYGSKTNALIFNGVLKDKVVLGVIEALDPDAENYEQRVSRKKFYERNGFHVLDEIVDVPAAGRFQIAYHGPETPVDVLKEKVGDTMRIAGELSAAYKEITSE